MSKFATQKANTNSDSSFTQNILLYVHIQWFINIKNIIFEWLTWTENFKYKILQRYKFSSKPKTIYIIYTNVNYDEPHKQIIFTDFQTDFQIYINLDDQFNIGRPVRVKLTFNSSKIDDRLLFIHIKKFTTTYHHIYSIYMRVHMCIFIGYGASNRTHSCRCGHSMTTTSASFVVRQSAK